MTKDMGSSKSILLVVSILLHERSVCCEEGMKPVISDCIFINSYSIAESSRGYENNINRLLRNLANINRKRTDYFVSNL